MRRVRGRVGREIEVHSGHGTGTRRCSGLTGLIGVRRDPSMRMFRVGHTATGHRGSTLRIAVSERLVRRGHRTRGHRSRVDDGVRRQVTAVHCLRRRGGGVSNHITRVHSRVLRTINTAARRVPFVNRLVYIGSSRHS